MALAVFAIHYFAFAQTSDTIHSENARKKVAVVLSGGGAKGMAHIGVLKVIEKAGIPVDIITGTSMGSIIGGLYSIGYNAHSLDSMVRKQDWTFVISDRENMVNQSLDDQRSQYTYALSRGFSFGKRNNDDGGLIKGKNLKELFQTLCTGYTDSLDFSKDLPIPFACVATNIIDNSEVDFHSGYLPQAMRASMAIPAAFSPVRIGDKVLVDGGLRNNYPADVARQMGADIIIGVTVQGEPKGAEQMGNTMSILSQIIDVNCKNKYDENLAITDVPIRVNTTGYGSASFTPNAIDTLIRRGEEEGMKHWDELINLKQRIGIDNSYKPRILQPLQPGVMTQKRKVTQFVFEKITKQEERFIRNKFHLNKVDSVDVDLQQQITTCMRVDLFYTSADCHLVPEGDGVRVVVTPGNRKTVQLYAGLRFDTEEYAALQLGADIPLHTKMPMDVDLTVRLGRRIMAQAELTLHPRSFTRPKISYTFRRNDMNIYIKGNRDYNVEYNQSQAMFTPINFYLDHLNLSLGLRWDYVHYHNKLEAEHSTVVNLENDHYFSYRARVDYVSEDNWYFPTKGSRFKAEYAYITDNFAKLNGNTGLSDVNALWRTALPITPRTTFQPLLYGRMLFGSEVPWCFGNVVGGQWFGHYVEQQMPFAGIGNIEYMNKHLAAAQLQVQQRIGTKHYVLLGLTGAQCADRLKNLFKEKTMFGVQATYAFYTIAGPLGATLGYSNHTKKVNFYINLGFIF